MEFFNESLYFKLESDTLSLAGIELGVEFDEYMHFGCDIYFQNADTLYTEAGALTIEVTAAADHDDNESRGNNIRWSIRRP